jgi:magnesium-transporting ATPase (P-type)
LNILALRVGSCIGCTIASDLPLYNGCAWDHVWSLKSALHRWPMWRINFFCLMSVIFFLFGLNFIWPFNFSNSLTCFFIFYFIFYFLFFIFLLFVLFEVIYKIKKSFQFHPSPIFLFVIFVPYFFVYYLFYLK